MAQDVDAIGAFFTTDSVAHVAGRTRRGGHAWVRRDLGALGRAFVDPRVDVEILVADGNRVAWQRTLRGTQRGAIHGFPASGRRIVWRDMVTSRFRAGRIAED